MITAAVAGLSLIFEYTDKPNADRYISGPCIAASKGSMLHGANCDLYTALSAFSSVQELSLINSIGLRDLYSFHINEHPLRWIGPVLYENTKLNQVVGDPSKWIGRDPVLSNYNIIVLANANPEWLARFVSKASSNVVSFDIHGEWLPYHSFNILKCVKKSTIVSIGKTDYQKLPLEILKHTSRFSENGAKLFVKDGSKGVVMVDRERQIQLPPAKVSSKVKTDVGAGDLLIGALGVETFKQKPSNNMEWEMVYLKSISTVGKLLESNTFNDFVINN